MSLPNVIIAGAPKCGTSSLYFWLAAHPEACASKVKETFFFADEVSRFNKGLNHIENGLEAYSRHFTHCKEAKVTFEATAPYIYFNTALEQIPQLSTKPKVIFVLREPAARAYSKFKFNKYKLQNFEGSFEEYVSLKGDFGSGKHVEEGHYIEYLKRWKKALTEERMNVLLFEDLLADKVSAMKKLASFLGLDPSFYDTFNFLQRNETVKLKNRGLHKLGLRLQPYVPMAVQDFFLPLYMKLNSGKMPSKNAIEKEQITRLKEVYRQSNKSLADHFSDLDLSIWS
jgi:hypothetical protein